ncbi:MAG: hypothetical protein L6R40_008736, partial [Gallowayella cf. fulva]
MARNTENTEVRGADIARLTRLTPHIRLATKSIALVIIFPHLRTSASPHLRTSAPPHLRHLSASTDNQTIAPDMSKSELKV